MKISAAVEAEFLASILKGIVKLESGLLESVEPGYFAVDSYKWLVKQLKNREWKSIEWDFIDQLLLSEISEDDEKRLLFREQLWHLYNREVKFSEDAITTFKSYIAYSIMKATTKSAFDGFGRTGRVDYLINDFSEAQRKASEIVREETFPIVDYASNYKNRVHQRVSERDNPAINPVVKMGIRGLDDQFKIKAPMIVDFFAPFKRYKSIVLNHVGFSSVLQGFNVLHVVFENTIEITEARYDALFSQISYDRVREMALTQDEKDNLDNFFERINNWDARLKIMKCTPKDTSLNDVEEIITSLKIQGFSPDVVIIDYLNIIAPNVYHREERLQQGQIMWDMKHLADTFNVPVFTASQANMEAASAERLSMKHRGKSIDISQGVNLSIALDQTPDEKKESILVFSPLFSRDDDIVTPEVVVDTDLSKMMITRDIGWLWEFAKNNDVSLF